MPDVISALIAFLNDDAAISTLTAGRVFGGELPRDATFAQQMPRACLVLNPSGGAQQLGSGYQQYGDQRIDVFAYAESKHASYELWFAQHVALKQMFGTIQDGTLIHWCRPAGGPLSLRDPATEWPYTMCSWQVLAAEIDVA